MRRDMYAERISIATLLDGAVVERVDDEIAKAAASIMDPNTNPTSARTVTLKLTFKADKHRENVDIKVDVDSKLAPASPLESSGYVGQAGNGAIIAERPPAQDAPHQMDVEHDYGEVNR